MLQCHFQFNFIRKKQVVTMYDKSMKKVLAFNATQEKHCFRPFVVNSLPSHYTIVDPCSLDLDHVENTVTDGQDGTDGTHSPSQRLLNERSKRRRRKERAARWASVKRGLTRFNTNSLCDREWTEHIFKQERIDVATYRMIYISVKQCSFHDSILAFVVVF